MNTILEHSNQTAIINDYYKNNQPSQSLANEDKYSFLQLCLLSELNEEIKENYEELIEEDKNDLQTYKEKLNSSIEHLELFFKTYRSFEENLIEPNLSINLSGEITLTWFGRKGARASMIFTHDKTIYFVFLFHGDEQSIKYYFSSKANLQIIELLDKLTKDK